MIKVTIEKVTEYDETASIYKDPKTERLYDSKYDMSRQNEGLSDAEEKEIWDRCIPWSRPTGKKRTEHTQVYVQTIETTEESKAIEGIIKAANNIE